MGRSIFGFYRFVLRLMGFVGKKNLKYKLNFFLSFLKPLLLRSVLLLNMIKTFFPLPSPFFFYFSVALTFLLIYIPVQGFTVILPEFRKDFRLRNFAINDSALLSYTTRWKPYLGHVLACHFAFGYRLMSSYFRKNLPSPRWTACIGVLIVLRTKTNVLKCPEQSRSLTILAFQRPFSLLQHIVFTVSQYAAFRLAASVELSVASETCSRLNT